MEEQTYRPPAWQTRLNTLWERGKWGLLALAIASQCFYAFIDGPAYQHDVGQQNGAVWNLLEGRGVALNVSYDANDISTVALYPVTWWPPMKTFLLAPLMTLTNNDIWWAAMFLEWAFLAVYFVAFFALLQAFSRVIAGWVRFAIFAVWVLLSAPTGGDTNMMSLACFILTIALSQWSLRLDRPTLGWGLAIGGAMAMAMALRYAYYPYIAILPLAFFAYGVLMKRKAWWLVGGIVAGMGLLTVLGVLLYNYAQSGVFLAQVQSETSRLTGQINWQHLQRFYPFAGEAIGANNVDYWLPRLGLPLILAHITQWAITLVLFAVQVRLSVLAWQTYRKDPQSPHPEAFFWGSNFLVHGLTIAMLSYMSLRYVAEVNGWTQVGDPRYFAPTWVFTVIAVGMMLSSTSQATVDRVLRGALLVCLVVTLGLGTLNRLGNWRTYAREGIAMGGLSKQENTLRFFMKQAQDEGLVAVVFVARLSDYPTYTFAEAGMVNAVAYRGEWQPDMTLATSKPTRVFLALPSDFEMNTTNLQIQVMKGWIAQYDAQALPDERLQTTVYVFDLLPNS